MRHYSKPEKTKMKKILSLILIAGVLSVAITSCKKDKKEDCTALSTSVSNKATAYMTDPSVANCNGYKTAINDYINSSCSGLTQAQKDEYQEMFNALDCE